jgi:hypothetical protein
MTSEKQFCAVGAGSEHEETLGSAAGKLCEVSPFFKTLFVILES